MGCCDKVGGKQSTNVTLKVGPERNGRRKTKSQVKSRERSEMIFPYQYSVLELSLKHIEKPGNYGMLPNGLKQRKVRAERPFLHHFSQTEPALRPFAGPVVVNACGT